MIRYVLLIIMVLSSAIASAQSNDIAVVAPNVVAVGAPFKIEFKTTKDPESIKQPSFEGFEVLAGPTSSTMSSISIINGKRESKNEIIYTYVLTATKAGNSKISPIEMQIDGKSVKSREILIEVVNEDTASQGTSSTSSATIQSDDILLLMNVSKQKVYSGEALVATVKLATRVELAGIEGTKYPSFDGFWTQEIQLPDNLAWQRENINDKIYETRILKKYLLFPQRSGELTIEKMSLEMVARITLNTPAQRRSIFDDFFGGGGSVQNIKRQIESSSIDIEVLPLPSGAPSTFSGAVGSFSIDSYLTQDMISANSSNNVVVEISGSGNLPLITQPNLNLPNSFEKYNVKTNDRFTVADSGSSGSKVFEYPFIARAAGQYDIEPIEFTFFNPKSKRYETLSTDALMLGVSTDTTASAENSSTKIYTGVTKQELEILGSDIRFIKNEITPTKERNKFFVGSWGYIGIIVLIICSWFGVLFVGRRRIKLNSDVVRVKSSKARKIALARLKEANRLLTAQQSQQFYQETLRAMWGYCSDKLNIESALLSKNNIESALSSKGIDKVLIFKYIGIIESCEFAQYAPTTDNSMSDIYNKSVDIIIELEEVL